VGIPFSSLPPDLQAKILGKDVRKKTKTPRLAVQESKFSRKCPCGSMMLRPDGRYEAGCPGCGKAFPTAT